MILRLLTTRPRSLASLVFGCLLLSIGCGEDRPPVATDTSLLRSPTEYVAIVSEGADVFELAQIYGFQIAQYDEAGRILKFTTEGDPNVPEFEAVQPNLETAHHGPISGVVYFYEGETAYGDQDALACMQIAACNAVPNATGEGVTVALLDTGIDHTHAWIRDNIEIVPNEILGRPDYDASAVAGYHATAMAGLIVTVAPDVTIVPFQVIGNAGTGTDFELAVGLQAAIAHGVDLINLSLAASEPSPVIEYLVQRAASERILFVAAAGNNTPDGLPSYPASGDAIAVAALIGGVDCDEIDAYSAAGGKVEFAAVGTEVISAYPGGLSAWFSGTSNAAAITTGALASLLDRWGPNPNVALNHLIQKVYPVAGAGGETVVYGGIDLYASLTEPN